MVAQSEVKFGHLKQTDLFLEMVHGIRFQIDAHSLLIFYGPDKIFKVVAGIYKFIGDVGGRVHFFS